MDNLKTMTVGELRQWLEGYPDDAPLYFGAGDLGFYRVKNRGPKDGFLAQVEFNELYHVDAEG
jgi:hypothetical protein